MMSWWVLVGEHEVGRLGQEAAEVGLHQLGLQGRGRLALVGWGGLNS